MSIEYLSPEWFREASRALTESEELASLAATSPIAMTQVITDAPEGASSEYVLDGNVTYHLELGEDGVRFGPGPAADEQIRLTESFVDAVRLARGDTNAQDLLIAGRLRFEGDHQAILDGTAVYGAIDAAFAPIRARTNYPDI